MHGSILRKLGKNTLDRGIKRARFSVLSGVRHPAILLEGGFMSHRYEARLIENQAYQAALASGIVDAIGRYRYAVSKEKMAPRNIPAVQSVTPRMASVKRSASRIRRTSCTRRINTPISRAFAVMANDGHSRAAR